MDRDSQLFTNSQTPEYLRGRERNVQEEADYGGWEGLADHLWDEHEVVVINCKHIPGCKK